MIKHLTYVFIGYLILISANCDKKIVWVIKPFYYLLMLEILKNLLSKKSVGQPANEKMAPICPFGGFTTTKEIFTIHHNHLAFWKKKKQKQKAETEK